MLEISSLFSDAIFQVITLAAPMLLVAMGVGLLVSIFQATTSIQEQTLTFVPKIAAIMLTLVYFWPWIQSRMVEYTINLLNSISSMSG